ncbi:hypothetical protein RRG08_029545 [Elysia crispata]|uniref:N-acetyltransferase domain-containing protein n=1 Tax=Elysia crispata TaxID=231223 RepID=A0AAE1CNC5_9GAST|nr:hypothetical protein RRG08_029545 [Elysia crispata]
MSSDSNKPNIAAVIVRDAEPGDIPQVYKLMEELILFLANQDLRLYTEEEFFQFVFGKNPMCLCLVAVLKEDPNFVVGYSTYFTMFNSVDGLSTTLEELYVKSNYRGKGIGTILWKKVTQKALDMGCNSTIFVAHQWNKRALDMYTRHGCENLTEMNGKLLLHFSKKDMEDFVKTSEKA